MDDGFDAIAEARRQWDAHQLNEPLAMAAATSIIRAQQIVQTTVDRALRPHRLTFARFEVLMLLLFSEQGALPITKVGERLMVHPTGITKLVDKLEHEGLVRRESNPRDRRSTLVRITPAGRRLARQASGAVAEVRFGAPLTDRELGTVVDVLEQLRRHAGDMGPPS